MTFYEWVLGSKGLDTPMGDLAGDMLRDPGAADVENTLDAWINRVTSRTNDSQVKELIRRAWRRYQQETVE